MWGHCWRRGPLRPGLLSGTVPALSAHLSELLWTPILLWESTEGFACSHRQTLWTRPGSWFDTERCPSDPFYHPTCGRNSAWWQHPLVILSPHQRQVQYTHRSLLISNIEITDRFLGRFLTETCKHFMFVIVLNCLLGEIPAGLSGTAV